VRVLNGLVDVAPFEPVGGEAVHAAAREWLLGERVERHVPVLPAVRLERAEALGSLLVRRGAHLAAGERRHSQRQGRERSQGRARRHGGSLSESSRPGLPACLESDQERLAARSNGGQEQHQGEHRERLPLARALAAVQLDHARKARRQPGHQRHERQAHQAGVERAAVAGEQHEHHQAGDRGQVGSARHRQQQHEAERWHECHGADPQARRAPHVRARVGGEHQAHRRERAECVPVGERLVEP